HALALCVRIDRAFQAGEVDLEPWLMELQQIYEQEIGVHFVAEEKEIFPSAQRFGELRPLVDELLREHTVLREYFVRAATRAMTGDELKTLQEQLSSHIRKEERVLFEGMQKTMTPEELTLLGERLENTLKTASQTCLIPNPATRLRPKADVKSQ